MVIYHYPPIGVIYIVILHVFIIINYPNFPQIITLIHNSGKLPLYIDFWRIYIRSHFPWTLTNRRRGNSNVLLLWYHVFYRDTMICKKELWFKYLNNMSVWKQKYYHHLGIIFLIKIMIFVFLFVVITTLIRLKFLYFESDVQIQIPKFDIFFKYNLQ